jgi:hypothetical protein
MRLELGLEWAKHSPDYEIFSKGVDYWSKSPGHGSHTAHTLNLGKSGWMATALAVSTKSGESLEVSSTWSDICCKVLESFCKLSPLQV